MINKKIKDLLLEDTSSMIVSASNTSMVFADNDLQHAVLLLTNVNYASIPVLDYDNHFIGLISNHQIMKFIGQKLFEEGVDILSKYKVKDAIDKRYYITGEDFDLEEVLRALVDYNFICLVDKDMKYKGMITRSNILRRVNYLLHSLDREFTISEKKKILNSINFA